MEFYGDYATGTALALANYVKAAADFLSDLIEVGLPDDPNMFHSYDAPGEGYFVDDLHIEIYIDKFKGPGSATIAGGTDVYAANDWDNNYTGGPIEPFTETPAGATITFNQNYIDTLDASGTLDDVVLHEMLHTLYFGLWETAENDLTNDSGVYTGAQGNLFHTTVDNPSDLMIIENEGLEGSTGAHWAEAVYDRELMTSVVETTNDMYLSDFSVASLMDLQIIDANDAAAQDYGVRGYTLDENWQTLVDALNDGGSIDLVWTGA